MAAGVIPSDVTWRHDILKGGGEQRSILELFVRVRDAAEPTAPADAEKLTWAGLTSRRMGDRQAIQSRMEAIAEGKVNVVRGRNIPPLRRHLILRHAIA